MELKWYERIILLVYYLLLVSGPIMIVINVMGKYEHGEIYACLLAYLFVRLWFRARDILNKTK